MSNNGSDKEREFFVTGTETYLDVDDAMAQFRRMVQDQCTTLVSRRLDEINRACEMDWTPNDLRDYTSRQSDHFNVGKQVAVENFGGLYFYLELRRGNDDLVYKTLVDLYRQRANLGAALWNCGAASGTAHCKGNDLTFEQLVSKDKIPDFVEHLNQAIDDFIKLIGDCGGLRKYLPPRS